MVRSKSAKRFEILANTVMYFCDSLYCASFYPAVYVFDYF